MRCQQSLELFRVDEHLVLDTGLSERSKAGWEKERGKKRLALYGKAS